MADLREQDLAVDRLAEVLDRAGILPNAVDVMPGEMIVTRRLSPASWRNPSEMARTANLVPAYTDWFGVTRNAAVDAVLMKWPKPCSRKTGSAAAMP